MTRESAKHQTWRDWYDGLGYVPQINPLYDRAFDAGWDAAIRAVAAALSDGAEFDRLIEGGES